MSAASQPGQLLFAGFEGTQLPPDLAALLEAGRVGGVVLFSRNVAEPAQLRELVAELHARAPTDAPLVVSIDQEGGRVQRLRAPWTEWPPMRRVASRDSPEDTAAVARAIGRELADLGIDLDFAPVVDVDTRPGNPVIGDRAFAPDPAAVARHAVAFVEALQAAGVAACAKHFPGHGDTELDSHVALPSVVADLERLRRVELPPFRAAIEAGVASVMSAHVVLEKLDAQRPGTLSRAVLSLLRDELGYDGLVFSDDLEMAAIAEHWAPEQVARGALEARVDVLLACRRRELRDALLAALEALPAALLEPSLRRLRAFKRRWSGGRRASRSSPPYTAHQRLAERLA